VRVWAEWLIQVSERQISFEVVRSALRSNLPFIGVASIVLAAGVAALVLSRLRSRDRLLFWLGIFASVYGVRLFVQNELVQAASKLDSGVFTTAALILTYVIPIAYAGFCREMLGSGWKNTISIWYWAQVAFAPIAIGAAEFAHAQRWTDLANNVLIAGGTVLTLLHVFLGECAERRPVRSLRWPLLVSGILVLGNNVGLRPARFDLEPLGFIILLAGLGYTASQRAAARERKLTEVEQELATARQIQNSILPRGAPRIGNLEIATRYQPMTAVAGDFYDFLRLGDESVTILVADVSGHGVPAALVASMLKICFAAQREQARDPAGVLAGFNRMLGEVLAGQYVTAACAHIDLGAKTVTYSGAGHPPSLLLIKSRGELLELSENGFFIGPFPQATYKNISARLESGDRLLLYTDGVVEAKAGDGEEFGRKRLMEFMLDAKHLAPAEWINALFARMPTGAPEDDLTVVLAQVG
jgi:phosphoserine phosphatase RsbU/P